MTRRIVTGLLVAALLLASPWIAYEVVEKTAEHVGPTGSLANLSLAAEIETPWRPETGVFVVDRALHEVAETRHFWRLIRQGGWDDPASAASVAALFGRH